VFSVTVAVNNNSQNSYHLFAVLKEMMFCEIGNDYMYICNSIYIYMYIYKRMEKISWTAHMRNELRITYSQGAEEYPT
jgi:hypothetical protein